MANFHQATCTRTRSGGSQADARASDATQRAANRRRFVAALRKPGVSGSGEKDDMSSLVCYGDEGTLAAGGFTGQRRAGRKSS